MSSFRSVYMDMDICIHAYSYIYAAGSCHSDPKQIYYIKIIYDICVYIYTYIRRSAGSCHSDPSSSRCTSYSPPSGTISSTTSTASSCSSSQSYSSCPPVSPLSLRTIFTNCFLLLLLHFHYVLSSKSLFCLWWCFHVFMWMYRHFCICIDMPLQLKGTFFLYKFFFVYALTCLCDWKVLSAKCRGL